MKFILYLTKPGELMVSQTEFWEGGKHTGPATVRAFQRDAAGTGPTRDHVFSWSKGPRSLAIFLLQAYASQDPLAFRITQTTGPVAKTLAEAMRDKPDGSRRPQLQKMFLQPNPAKREPMPKHLFDYIYRDDLGKFMVALGPDWHGATFVVKQDGREVDPARFHELVDELMERWPRQAPPAPPPLQASIEVLVYNEREADGVALSEYGLPLATGAQLQIRTRLSRPAFPYVVWVTSQGRVDPLYPWSEFRWRRRGMENPVDSLALPSPDPSSLTERWYPLDSGAGFEMLILMARDEILPKTYDPRLAKALESLRQLMSDCELKRRRKPYEFVCRISPDRADIGTRLGQPQPVSDPLSRLKHGLAENLGDRFSLIQGIIFTNDGPKQTSSSENQVGLNEEGGGYWI